jgi:hypothetical protein
MYCLIKIHIYIRLYALYKIFPHICSFHLHHTLYTRPPFHWKSSALGLSSSSSSFSFELADHSTNRRELILWGQLQLVVQSEVNNQRELLGFTPLNSIEIQGKNGNTSVKIKMYVIHLS